MSIETRSVEGITVVEVHGKLTFDQNASNVQSKVRELVQKGSDEILLNLGGVSYLDSIGLESLVVSYTTVRKSGGKLRLSNLSKKTRHLLEITRLSEVLEAFPSEEEALASF